MLAKYVVYGGIVTLYANLGDYVVIQLGLTKEEYTTGKTHKLSFI